ncbi:MAG TPA: HEAT repeat domain-containing protein [Candidatus Binataceae bacterium]|nr:HEAT repeat domain-containing protein [Candidatus Binataceae bacterium]
MRDGIDIGIDSLADALGDPARTLDALMHLAENGDVQLSPRALDALARCLGAESKAIQRRAADAFAAIALHDNRAQLKLREVLDSSDLRARWPAAYALARLGAGEHAHHAADALFAALANDDGDVRWAASGLVLLLGEANRETVIGRLLTLAHDDNAVARRMALYCLRDLRASGPAVLEAIESASRAGSHHLRLAALAALVRLENSREAAAEIALRCLESDPDPGVRRAAAATLGTIANSSPRMRAALERAASTEGDESMQRAARSALTRMEQR